MTGRGVATHKGGGRAKRPGRRTKGPEKPKPRRRAKPSAKPRRRPGRRTWMALALVIVVAAGGWGLRIGWKALVVHPALVVREIEVVGPAHASPDELQALAGIEPGDSWLGLDRANAVFRLESHPWVAKARVRRPGVGRVRLVVEECVPVARLEIAGRTYGVCGDLRIVPDSGDTALPRISIHSEGRGRGAGASEIDPAVLGRGIAYVAALTGCGLACAEPIDVELGDGRDEIRVPARGFEVRIEAPVPPATAVRNATAFLERLDAEGESRGTLRLISDETAVWKAV